MKRAQVVEAKVVSAIALSASQMDDLKKTIKRIKETISS
jgi:F0F1-type ATP synthase delta subunit